MGKLTRTENGLVVLTNVRWCSSFLCRLRGLMMRGTLQPGEGLLMVEALPSKAAAAIHMLFMNFPIAVVWLDSDFTVVDLKLAKPWGLMYAPAKPALYTLETSPDILSQVQIGDKLEYVK